MLFKCKVCQEKDKRIADLQKQINFMQRQLIPVHATAQDIEMNKMLEGASLPIIELKETTEDKAKEDLEVEREAVSIITGNYYEQVN